MNIVANLGWVFCLEEDSSVKASHIDHVIF
jgi:hypothetical protein